MAGRFEPQADDVPHPPSSNLLGSLLATVFCCVPFGLIALIYGLQVSPKFKKGDEEGAQHASDMSEKWMYASVGAFVLMGLAYVGYAAFVHFFGPKTGVPSTAAR